MPSILRAPRFLLAAGVTFALGVAVLVMATAGSTGGHAQAGQYLYFTGPGGGYLEVADDPAFNLSAITVEAWLFLEDLDSRPLSGEPSIAGKDYADGWLFTVWNGSLRFYRGAGADSVIGDMVLPTGEWVHVAASYENGNVCLFVNDQIDKCEALPGGLGTSTEPLRIGSDVQWQYSPQGALDELRIWDHARSLSAIISGMNSELTDAEPGLVGVWNMNSADADVGGFPGTLVGDAEFRDEPLTSPTPTASPTEAPTPTAAPATMEWGNSDCDEDITTRDNQALLREVLNQPPLSQEPNCPELGDVVTADGVQRTWGDWDCDGEISTRDNQALLREVLAQAALSQTEPCPDLGDEVALT